MPKKPYRINVITKQKYDGNQRKLAFFSRQPKGLYFEVGGFFMGSHTSYHIDGNIFRTSPATQNKPKFEGNCIALDRFEGLYQLGTFMLSEKSICSHPLVKNRDRKGKALAHEIDISYFPNDTLNVVTEILEPNNRALNALMNTPDFDPPKDALMTIIKDIEPWVILTVLGHDHNLLVTPTNTGFRASHFNSRFSANKDGVKYNYEAYARD